MANTIYSLKFNKGKISPYFAFDDFSLSFENKLSFGAAVLRLEIPSDKPYTFSASNEKR